MIPVSSDQNVVQTPSQGEKRREELECGEKEKEVKEAAEKAKEALDGEVPKPTEHATVLPVRTGVILSPPPATQGPLPDENVPPVAGPSGRATVDKSPPLPTLSPADMFHSAGRLDPDKITVGDRYYQGGQGRNSFRAFSRLSVFRRLTTSQAGTHLPNNLSLGSLAPYNQSSESASPTPPGPSSG